jgi:hypothetical protein
MTRSLGSAVGTAIPGLVASLLPWGVTDGHWLAGAGGRPVLWLATGTEEQRLILEAQTWLPTHIRMMLLRHGVQPEQVADVRLMLESAQSHDALLGDV